MSEKTERFKFYNHSECEYFPCHELPPGMAKEDFNCLFCYCPLYALGDGCGGRFDYSHGVKDCSACMIPHSRGGYDYIMERFNDISRLAKKNHTGDKA